MKIIAVNRFYWPSESATSQILTDLAGQLAAGGAEVHVIAGRRPGEAKRERRDGVAIHRVWTSWLGGMSLLGRAADYASFYLSASLMLLRLARRGDRLVVKTDPPLLSVPAGLIARLRGARTILWHQDLFPETAEAVRVVQRGGWLARLARALRNLSMRSAEVNVAICESMADRIARQGVPRDRIVTIPNWCDGALAPVAPADNPLRAEWGVEGRLVIGYSGNLGRVHQAELVAELVRRSHGIDGLVWTFVGGGVGTPLIRALQEEFGTDFVRILPAQPRGRLSLSLSLPDLHLVSLDPACEGLVMPSKLYGIMAVARPVLNLGVPDGEVAREVARHRMGVTLDPAEPARWRAALERMVADRAALGAMGANARQAYARAYRPEQRLRAWERLLERDLAAPAGEQAGTALQKRVV